MASSDSTSGRFPALNALAREAFILAYKEDTSRLEEAFRQQGITPTVLRPTYSETELTYSRSIRCLLNHMEAWRRSAARETYTIIVEADFAPCRGFGQMPVPFDPARHNGNAWAFLYSAYPRLLERYPDGSTVGNSSCPVAYLVSPKVAGYLCRYGPEELERHKDLTQYSLWDTSFNWHIVGMGGLCFMARRQFGDHGGMPNREHGKSGQGLAVRVPLLKKLGIGSNHHADVLQAPLMFLPIYAKGRWTPFLLRRFEAKTMGFLRLLAGMTVVPWGEVTLAKKLRLYGYATGRLIWPY